ncbi:uncharacterized protein BO97DRAFT_425101 [Aspergillus homomorphus CBS 101889]|uniref:Uncharacterized protein n=1 Tax=Aspergillus homomorphus (strain CBS 101889) TaxID=1450537 RepID=A0A395HV40_ASPHC|nr:hypothetical protein BO97DRAFT_425101 [Aspergillus homomorphus CBS 101889]RAL11802.1 hypothetical protein BO97DRAFT_425101 [Aspergillus homomorphus CBS 101889]
MPEYITRGVRFHANMQEVKGTWPRTDTFVKLSSEAQDRLLLVNSHRLEEGECINWNRATLELGARFRGMRHWGFRPLVKQYGGVICSGDDKHIRMFTESTEDGDPIPFERDGRVEFCADEDFEIMREWALGLPACEPRSLPDPKDSNFVHDIHNIVGYEATPLHLGKDCTYTLYSQMYPLPKDVHKNAMYRVECEKLENINGD